MIIKNICPYPKQLKTLGNLYLMPGEQSDISKFSQQERNSCTELQEAFRKGEMICVGVGQEDFTGPDAHLRIARSRMLEKGSRQPLLPIMSGPVLKKSNQVANQTEEPEQSTEGNISNRRYVAADNRIPQVRIVGNPTGFVKEHKGVAYIEPVGVSQTSTNTTKTPDSSLSSPIPPKQELTITVDRMREIMSRTCISMRTNGKKCRRSCVNGYEYCMNHMPANILEEYKRKKKETFFE